MEVTILTQVRKWIGLLIYPFFILATASSSGQSTTPTVYSEILNLQFRKLEINEAELPSNIPNLSLYLENLSEISRLIFTENEQLFDSLKKNENTRLKQLKDQETPSPWTDFFRAEIKIQWAFTKLKFGEQWSAVWSLRSAYRIIQDNIEAYPAFRLNYKSLGLLHVIFGAVPDNRQWVLGLLGLEGDTEKGLEELRTLLNDDTLFEKEVRLITALIQSYLLEDHEAALNTLGSGATSLTHSENYVSALIHMKSHQSARAGTLLESSISQLSNSSAQPLFLYLLAETQLQAGKYDQALVNYELFLTQFKGVNHRKDATFKLGLCWLFQGDPEQAEKFFTQASSLKLTEAETDKNAHKLLKEGLPDPKLLQLRYAIDGGFYELADSLLKSIQLTDLKPYEQFELIYRKARLSHLRKDHVQAMRLYREVITKEEEIPETYFVPNSFLQLGYLQLELGNEEMARMYFEKVLTFRRHPYKNSLESKAKIALKGLRKSDE